MLATAPITARTPEARVQELLNEWLKSYFSAQPHISPLGDATFDLCDILFNQADLPSPQTNPQIHTVFTAWRSSECWWINGRLGTWNVMLSNPASGVSYGATTDRTVEESVHGALARRISPATDIRWRDNAGAFVEEVFDGLTWNVLRTFPEGTTSLRWTRTGSTYTEAANVSGTWTTIRTIAPSDPTWNGTKSQVTANVELSHFIRVASIGGDLNKSDFSARRVAANLDELYRTESSRSLLTGKGFRSFTHRSGPRPIPTSGYVTRLLVYAANIEFYMPKEGI